MQSGNSIYNKKFNAKQLENPLAEIFSKLPHKKYAIIYADPPWHYNGKMQFDKSGITTENPNWQRDIFISSACFKYPTLRTKDLMRLSVANIAKADSLLFLWTTNPHLE